MSQGAMNLLATAAIVGLLYERRALATTSKFCQV